jgi:hypothetical protein
MAAYKRGQQYTPPFSVCLDRNFREAGKDNLTTYYYVDGESFPTSRDDFAGGLSGPKRTFRNQENENPRPDNASPFGVNTKK